MDDDDGDEETGVMVIMIMVVGIIITVTVNDDEWDDSVMATSVMCFSNYPSIQFLHLLILRRVTGGLQPFPAYLW